MEASFFLALFFVYGGYTEPHYMANSEEAKAGNKKNISYFILK